jgi:hypothetical protein
MRPFCLNCWPSEGYVIDSSVMLFLLSFSVEVCARSPGNHVNDPTKRLIGEVFLFGFQGSPWWSARSLHREKGSRTFAVAGLDLYLCLWGCWRGPVVWGTLGDERCLQTAVDWQWCSLGAGCDLASRSQTAPV